MPSQTKGQRKSQTKGQTKRLSAALISIQNGFTTARTTITIRNTVGTSLTIL